MEQKRIIIVGANEGIGYYLAKGLLEQGHIVGILDILLDNVYSLKEQYGDRLFAFKADARNYEEILDATYTFIDAYGGIDIALHNACNCTFDSMEETGFDTYQKVFDINYFGALRFAKAVLPYMKKQASGKIIFTSSGVGVMGFYNISPYASSKGAIESLAKCLKIELEGYNISLHIIHPPLCRTTSAKCLPIPEEMKAEPSRVGYGLAKRIVKTKLFIICHSFSQKVQTMFCYWFPLKMGHFMSFMTKRYQRVQKEKCNQK